MKRKFIRAGSSRKVYSLGNGHCIKIPIKERCSAGRLQNKFEVRNLTKYGEYSCFPKLYSYAKNYSKIKVEECALVDNYSFHAAFCNILSIDEINSVPRLDRYKHVPIDSQYARWLAFVFGDFMDFILNNQDQLCKCSDFSDFKSAIARSIDIAHSEMGINDNVKQTETIARQIMKFMSWLDNAEKDSLFIRQSFKDLITFYICHGKADNFLFADLWNITQWGQRRDNGAFVVVDVGYSIELSKSEHYSNKKIVPLSDSIQTTEPGAAPDMFNGEKIDCITSPGGAGVSTKFYTKSEYILADDGMSRHIKRLGLQDDGLWWWSDKMTFMPYEKLTTVMSAIRSNSLTAIKIGFGENSLSVNVIGPGGKWKELLNVEDISYTPKLGWHVCEFTFDGFNAGARSGILKKYHPGHAVSYIEQRVSDISKKESA